MNKQEYLDLRNGLYTEAENLINEGKLEEGQSKIQEITNLDNKFENEAKALANLNALKDNSKVTNLENLGVQVAGKVIDSIDNANLADDFTNSKEYRKSFMNYVINGDPINSQFKNANANTKTADVGEMIPQTVLEKIIEKLEATGMIYNLVTKTNYKGGVKIPTSSVKPTALWVAEGSGSDKQRKLLVLFHSDIIN